MISHIPINKIKSVIIGDGLVFKPHKNTLKDISSGEIATLNNVAVQLLMYLLQNGKDISTRDEILLNVFQHNGARATDANLNQHISFLRKAITSTGHPAEYIVTIPRTGFRMGDVNINIQQQEEKKPLTSTASFTSVRKTKKQNRWPIAITALITGIAVLATAWLTWIPNEIAMTDASILRTIDYEQCRVHILGNALTDTITEKKALDIFKSVGINPNCSTPKELYLNTWSSNHNLVDWSFAAECGLNLGYYHCISQYRHHEE
ncbi:MULTISPECIES: winged helix-turn-helix domain-containing protein [Citrobacter]|uniref:Transcriptional regulator n=1 Tax=Citrobacter gillenii TaxID=67828 RepID=A0ABD6LY89_9ENTR|nr:MULTISPECIES: winged helix-turn-helix domain-containing protein [Citrobacter]MBD0829528.1 winged helix-turn-helix domain-containing protein [Citrobacter sp. C1]MBA8199162.1 winged helix-turn-helix domain-containing protein [Citrobacter freundii]MCS3465159.1 DNA-binding winged helix-turn-helix (wHTH) protein [Citrobacter sp. JUb117]NTZ49438.1 transcriptional regulator [Citrobacter gillenii]QCA19767.1 transcriptional regulator [Citrobacter freundii]